MTENDTITQLTLLPPSQVPARFQLDEATRRRGLRHIAEIRQRLADREAAREQADETPARAPIRPTAA